ncbi:MAG: ATP-binding cassette, subfamily er 3 [Actinomycetota bacterium]|jgi:ATP-binding cassette subfamily F protein 3|nr:ATP-binding cassette, subfamily er 3 [Actinomycetota bacterium]
MLLTISDLHKAFGSRDLFKGATLQMRARDRVALVGPNGSGKTTLLDMIAGFQAPDRGEIHLARDLVLGYLQQETDDLRGKPLIDEVLSAGSDVIDAGHRLSMLENEIAETEGAERDGLLAEYARLQDRFATLGGYALGSEAERILMGLGFTPDDLQRPTESFSGGWLMRIALAKLLLIQPDLLLLDEPTNHLDLASVEWFESFLRDYEGAVLLISHDRDFMNGFARKVIEIEGGKLDSYSGDYASFVEQRANAALQREALAKQQGRKIAATERFIERFRYKNTKARQVQSRIKSLEKMDRVETVKQTRKRMGLRFPPPPRPGRVVLELDDVAFRYGDGPLIYEDLELVVERGQKIALVGPNGAGKSTLLKLIAGVLQPNAGARRLGHNAAVGYFAQHQIEALDLRRKVLDEFASAIPTGLDLKPRDLLGRFLFSGDDVDKHVSVLSGGERTRLAMAKMLISPSNLLCLDEPTNHLDVQSRDVLEDALEDYQGAFVLITHDRHLIRSVADEIIEVVGGRVTRFPGDYDYYLSKREGAPEEAAAATPETSGARPAAKDRRRAAAQARARLSDLRKTVVAIERKIEKVQEELGRIEARLGDPEIYSTDTDVGALVREFESIRKRAGELEAAWEKAASELESAESALG